MTKEHKLEEEEEGHDHSHKHNHSHGHHNHHHHGPTDESSLKLAIILTFVFFLAEVVGGIASGSLSLLGDAGHMSRDVFALFLSLTAIQLARKLPSGQKNFGYHRFEVLAALFNGIMLIVISLWIFVEAWGRYHEPEEIDGPVMFIVAVIGLIVNLFIVFRLHGSHDLNVRSAFLHVLTDTLSSVAVILAALWIMATGEPLVDSVLSVIIGIIILASTVGVIRESIYILLEYTPPGVDYDEVRQMISKIDGVDGVHELHIWSLCSHVNALNAHVSTCRYDMREVEKIKDHIKADLDKYHVKHVALEFECPECTEPECEFKLLKHEDEEE